MTLPINISDCDLDVMTMHIFLITCLINENYKFQIGFCWLELEAIPNILGQLVECYDASTQHTAPNFFKMRPYSLSNRNLLCCLSYLQFRCPSPKYENGFYHWRHLALGRAMNTNDEIFFYSAKSLSINK